MAANDYEHGVALYDAGRYWDAHEVWERPWGEAAPGSIERLFFQGLIQTAAAAIKAGENNAAGVRRLCAKAIEKLERVAAAAPDQRIYRGIDVVALIAALRAHDPPRALTTPAP